MVFDLGKSEKNWRNPVLFVFQKMWPEIYVNKLIKLHSYLYAFCMRR